MTAPYRVILADPPWAFRDQFAWRKLKGGSAARHYRTLDPEAICALPIGELAAPDSALFLWITSAHLLDAGQVMRAWGFTYRTVAFTWLKADRAGQPMIGPGHYTRPSTELCLLGLRGSPAVRTHDVRQVIITQRREHSRKPDEQYERIMRLFDGPYLELFARQQWPGWDTWGLEAGKFPSQPFMWPDLPDAQLRASAV